jgi:hypothetical protein
LAVTVIRYGDDRIALFEELALGREVLLFDPLEERGRLTVGDRFRTLDPAVQEADTIVFRSSSRSTLQAIKRDPILPSLLDGRNVLHLGRSYEAARPQPALTPVTVHEPIDFLLRDELRQAELEAMLRRTRSVFDDDNHHYLLPSGWHADRFVRLGNACASLPDNRRLADWVIGYVDESHDLLGDTGTILPLLQEVQRHCARRFGWRTKIDALSEYPSVEALASGLQDLRSRASGERGVMFVISVNSSGTALARFETSSAESINDRAVAICETNPTLGENSVSLVHLPSARWAPGPDGDCEACGSPARVVVHPTTYEATAAFKLDTVPITPDVATEQSPTFQMLSDCDALHFHYTSDRGSHYAIWVDTPQLLRRQPNADAFAARIATLPGADVVLVPGGPATTELVEIARNATGQEPHQVTPGGALSPDAVAAVRNADHVLIVDDTVVSGTTLGRLRRAVYQAAQPNGRSPRTSAAVFLSRPSSSEDLTAVRRPYRSTEGVDLHSLHSLILPSGKACSFCSEQRLLRGWYRYLSRDSQEFVASRLEQLDAAITGPIFLGSRTASVDLVTAGSFFGQLSERGGFSAASAATQKILDAIRVTPGGSLARTIDVAAALDAYFDPCLLVGILRTCKKEQVRFAATDPSIRRRYPRMSAFGEDLTDAVRCEIVWAALREILPREGVEALLDGIDSAESATLGELLMLRSSHVL